jgi:Major Facilitator Superfamily
VYIIEGLFSIVVAVWIWFGLPTDPAQAYFLNDEEKWMMQVRKEQSKRYLGPEKFDWAEFRIEMRDPKLYIRYFFPFYRLYKKQTDNCSAAIQFCQDIMLYGFSTFLPAILNSMGYDTLKSNALTVPVYVWGVISFTALAWWADRTTRFAPFLLGANVVSIIGYILLLAVKTNDAVRYFATYLCVVGCYLGPGINLAWLNVNVAPHHRRSTAVGVQQSIANTAGIVAGQVYRASPYVLGNSFSLGAVCLSQFLILGNTFYLKRQTAAKKRVAEGEEDKRKVTSGDRAVDYKYFY